MFVHQTALRWLLIVENPFSKIDIGDLNDFTIKLTMLDKHLSISKCNLSSHSISDNL